MSLDYESAETVHSRIAAGVSYRVAKMSFARRMDLMRRVRELTRRAEFLSAGQDAAGKVEAALLHAEIDKLYASWGLQAIDGLRLDGEAATPESLLESGPEELFREAVAAVQRATGLTPTERKNC